MDVEVRGRGIVFSFRDLNRSTFWLFPSFPIFDFLDFSILGTSRSSKDVESSPFCRSLKRSMYFCVCENCQVKGRFYDAAALFQHLHRDHYVCDLCERRNVRHQYYR